MPARSTHRASRGPAILFMAAIAAGGSLALAVPPDRSRRTGTPQIVDLYGDDAAGATSSANRSRVSVYTVDSDAPQAFVAAAGGDNCNTAVVVPVTAGAPGSPNIVNINGDTTPATALDCFAAGVLWWEAFSVDRCSDVVIDFCGTTPRIPSNFIALWSSCAPDGSTCGDTLSADGWSRDLCAGETSPGNMTLFFDSLPAGTYYYPIIVQTPGPYVMNISAEECSGACTGCLGGCCNSSTGVCADDISQTACTGPSESWSRNACCATECRTSPPEYDAVGVELLSRVAVQDFPSGSVEANDVWGYTSPRGRKYAIIGLTDGTGFVDITHPRTPIIIADIPDAHSIWSDMAVYRDYAYNVNENFGGMQVIDMTQIDDGIVTLTGVAAGGMQTAHNVYVNPESGFAYPCGTDQVGGFIAYSLANPAHPIPVGSWNESYIHDLQAVSYDQCPNPARAGQPCELVFVFTGGAGMKIVDATDKANMTTLATLTYPTMDYCHQGWLSSDRRYLFFNDELDENSATVFSTTTYVADIQDILAPTLAATFDHPGCWIDHNLIVRGDRIYQAHYAAGLRILDATDPLGLSEIAHFDTHPESNVQDFVGGWGIYTGMPTRVVLLSDIERGLFVLCDEPERSIPSFTLNDNPALCDTPIHFDASGSTTCDPVRTLASYEWDFNYSGSTFTVDATGLTTSHTFADDGDFTVALRVTDDLSNQETTTLGLSVVCPPPIPTVSQWGLLAMSFALLAAGYVVVARSRPSEDVLRA